MSVNRRLSDPSARMAAAISLLATVLVLPCCTLAADTNWSRDDAAHLLRRAGFGGTPAQIDHLFALGQGIAVDYLITGTLPAGAAPVFDPVELQPFTADSDSKDGRALFELEKMRAAWLERMVRSSRPLEEKMSLFWHGLFCSSFIEVRNIRWMADQNALFHREAIGNYKRLTHGIIHDAAMIKYLNNDENIRGHSNENLARELMELFTMGEGNGYTEKDIPEVARALTGMHVSFNADASEFIERVHDDGPKTIFGKTGNYLPDDVVDLIFDRPEPATYLATRLWQFFGNPEPAQEDIAAVARALRDGKWELAPALRVLFTSPSFYGESSKFQLIKSPVELVVMNLRLLEEPAHPRIMFASAALLTKTGEDLFMPPNVKGWPGGRHWITSSTLDARFSLSSGLARGLVGGSFAGGDRFLSAGRNNPRAGRPTTGPTTGPTSPEEPARAGRDFDAKIAAALARAKAAGREAEFAARLAKLKAQQAANSSQRVQEEVAKIPPLPSADELVAPASLFASLGSAPTSQQVVDAAVARFLQRPLSEERKATLTESLGADPLLLGESSTDQRVRQMMALLMCMPEYQLE